jgi:hypothetical protein
MTIQDLQATLAQIDVDLDTVRGVGKHLSIYVNDELVSLGRDEDGEEVILPAFFVVAEFPSGRRFRHQATFRPFWKDCSEETGPMNTWPDGGRFPQRADEASALRFAVKIACAYLDGTWDGLKDNPYWSEIPAAYGSEAYIKGGWEAKTVAWEKSREGVRN